MDFSITLLEWFRENGRDLPWRQTHDPYAIWLSEIILQQTQVKQGWEYWERFMHRWPTVEALAEATEDEVKTDMARFKAEDEAEEAKKAYIKLYEH